MVKITVKLHSRALLAEPLPELIAKAGQNA